jgi:outer membrane protein assembly factor BamE (lipoprotein component of BamABCDE complex)
MTRLISAFVICVLTACASGPQIFLNDDKINSIQRGMTGDDVLMRIGEPYQRVAFANLNATAWDYRYTDSWGYRCEFSVMIDADNKVTGKVNRRLERNKEP